MARTIANIRKTTIACVLILSLGAKVICNDLHLELPTINPEEVNPEETTFKTTTEENNSFEHTKGLDYQQAVYPASNPKQVENPVSSSTLENQSDVPIDLNESNNKSKQYTSLEGVPDSNFTTARHDHTDGNNTFPTQNTVELEEKAYIIGQSNILLKKETGDIIIATEYGTESARSPDVPPTPTNGYISGETESQQTKNVTEPSDISSTPKESAEDTSDSSLSYAPLIPELDSGENQSDIIQDRIDIAPDADTETSAENRETSLFTDETGVSGVATPVGVSTNKGTPSEQSKLSKYSDSQEEIDTRYTERTESPETSDKTSESDSKKLKNVPEENRPTNPSGLAIDMKSQEKSHSGLEVNNSKSSVNETVSSIGGRIGADIFNLEPTTDGNKGNKAGKGLAMPKTLNDRKIENLAEEKIRAENITRASKLKSWLEDPYLRAPVALLVPLKPKALNRALGVWRELVNTSINLTDLILIGYDNNGIGWLSRHSLQRGNNMAGSSSGASSVTASLVKLLQKQMNRPTALLTPSEGVLHACARAARLVPYDSAVFAFADERPTDDGFSERAARVLVAKRLKLYTIWMDPNFESNQPDAAFLVLRSVSRGTDGDFISFYPNIEEISMDAERSNQSLEDEKIWDSSEVPIPSVEDRKMRSNYVLHSYTGTHEHGIRVMDQTLIYRRGGGGHVTLGVPVDGGIRDLRLTIEGTLERAALYPPTGPQVDLFNASSVAQFYPGSILISNSPLEVLLKLPSRYNTEDNMYSVIPANAERTDPTPTRSQQDGGRGRGPLSGVWRLSVRCAECRYRVLVTARATLGFDATLIGDKMIRLRVHGPVATVRETSLVDDKGNEIVKLPFRHQPVAGEEAPSSDNKLEEELKNTVLVADVPVETLNPNITIYAQAVGRDIYGESFIRMSGPITSIQDVLDLEIPRGRSATKTIRSAAIVFSGKKEELENPDVELIEENQSDQPVMSRNINASTFATQILTSSGELLTGVQIGLSTRLYGAPGEILQLHFEVTNYRDQSVYFRFGATGTLNFLRSISPQWQWVNSGQTVNVIVTAGITSNAEIGARDTIVFTATGVDQVTLSSYIYVVSSSIVTALDSWPPTMTHTFQGDCLGKQGSDCASNIWSATVTARDQEGGLLRISSSPAGLRYGSGFISGTREEVTASYRASCCATRVVLSASDLYGNVNAYTVDISGYLTPATIAAITLGVFLIIAIILIVIFLIWFCVRKRQESRELSYATARRDT